MSYGVNRFLIVFASMRADIEIAHKVATQVMSRPYASLAEHTKPSDPPPKLVSPIMHGVVNERTGFIVWTSGSAAGWDTDDEHIARLDDLLERLSRLEHPPDWIRVGAGADSDDFEAARGHDGDYSHTYEVTEMRARRRRPKVPPAELVSKTVTGLAATIAALADPMPLPVRRLTVLVIATRRIDWERWGRDNPTVNHTICVKPGTERVGGWRAHHFVLASPPEILARDRYYTAEWWDRVVRPCFQDHIPRALDGTPSVELPRYETRH